MTPRPITFTGGKLVRIGCRVGRPNVVDLARLRPLSMGLNRSKDWAAFETFPDHIALFNECIRFHLNNELRQ